jgi:hypothetical protein
VATNPITDRSKRVLQIIAEHAGDVELAISPGAFPGPACAASLAAADIHYTAGTVPLLPLPACDKSDGCVCVFSIVIPDVEKSAKKLR